MGEIGVRGCLLVGVLDSELRAPGGLHALGDELLVDDSQSVMWPDVDFI